jgi:hypothetical protein
LIDVLHIDYKGRMLSNTAVCELSSFRAFVGGEVVVGRVVRLRQQWWLKVEHVNWSDERYVSKGPWMKSIFLGV